MQDPLANDKYANVDLMIDECYMSSKNTDFDIVFKHQIYLNNFESSHDCKGVKHRLKNVLEFWKSINASDFIISTISTGYVIPFIMPPKQMCMKNNRSALLNMEFVSEAVSDLLETGCILQVPFKPVIVNPLSVAVNGSGKKRLILDLSVLNKFVRRDKVKFEDWKVAIQYFQQGCYMFKFDLKSGYHHIDICSSQQTFLGFSWESFFYVFTVLPFGLSSAPYIFTKCLRPIVKYWRQSGINIVLYLDDGLGMAQSYEKGVSESVFVRDSLERAGFLVNSEKSVFQPCQKLEWLGLLWNSNLFCLSITEKRIQDCKQNLADLFHRLPHITARQLAQFTGRIISMGPVIGNVSRLMTRKCYELIESRFSWDSLIKFDSLHGFITELVFWSNNLENYNCRYMNGYSKTYAILCTDASSVAAGAVCHLSGTQQFFHSNFSKIESAKSSTWRELKAIQLALFSYKEQLSGKSVKIFTDSKNCVSIVKSGSIKSTLQDIAFSIFHLCLQKRISLDIAWIPRTLNDQADFLSKLVDHDDWSVSQEFFEFMNDLWGPFTVDRFASHSNTKLPRFNSLFWNPGTDAVDCFSQDWYSDNNWLVPPIHLVLRTVRHLLYCRSRGTLIVPYWPSSPFWSMIFGPGLTYRSYVLDVIEFKDTAEIMRRGTSNSCIFGTKKFTGSLLAVKLGF